MAWPPPWPAADRVLSPRPPGCTSACPLGLEPGDVILCSPASLNLQQRAIVIAQGIAFTPSDSFFTHAGLYVGAGMVLTGGCSELRGIKQLAEEAFEMPVQLCRAQNVSGVTSAFENPQYSTAIGLVKYAQATLDDNSGGLFDLFKGWFR